MNQTANRNEKSEAHLGKEVRHVDGDSDNDVLITGQTSLSRISKLYTNNGAVTSTGDQKIELDLVFTLFPNPSTSNTLFWRCDQAEFGEVTIKLYDENGVLLRQKREYSVLGRQTFSIDITSLAQGSYFIELDNSNNSLSG